MISLKNIVVYFNRGTPTEKLALKSVSLDIAEGEFITVIGTNGAGKSTLLGALSGEVRVHGGQILIENQDITNKSVARRSKWIGRVFQDPMVGTCSEMTVEENLALALRRSRKTSLKEYLMPAVRPTLTKQFIELLASLGLGLENRLSSPIGLLSGGQRQAISLLMTTLSPMKILLLDEHTAALDPKTAKYIIELTREIVKEYHLTTLMVTHSLEQAIECGSRLIMLKEGQIALDIKKSEKNILTVDQLLSHFYKE
jgi:putative ABC transport system ATP-binding protein